MKTTHLLNSFFFVLANPNSTPGLASLVRNRDRFPVSRKESERIFNEQNELKAAAVEDYAPPAT
jgi:hypothetical protein